jgi:MFS transporter, DHA1 family, multidrug resistance protein
MHKTEMPASLLVLLACLIGFAPLAIDMYLPALPQIAKDLHAPEAAVQATVAAYLVGMAAGQVLYGMLADRFGRKPPLLLGLVVFALASLGCAQAQSVSTLTLWRTAQALGGCAGVVMSLTIVADRVHGQAEMARAMSRLMGVIGLAPIVAPVLGNALMQWTGWRGIFLLLATLSSLAAVVVLLRLEETWPAARRDAARASGPRSSPLSTWAALLRDRAFAGVALAGPLANAGMFAYIGTSAFVLINQHGLTPAQFSLVFAGNAAVATLTTQLNVQAIRRWGPERVARTALSALSATGLALSAIGTWAPTALWPFLALLAVFMGLLGFVNANTSALALAGHPPARRGLVSGLMGTLQFAGGGVVGALMGAAGGVSGASLGISMAACALLAALAMRLRDHQAVAPASMLKSAAVTQPDSPDAR